MFNMVIFQEEADEHFAMLSVHNSGLLFESC